MSISIVITTHRLDYLFRRALHSIKAQKIQPDEVIVVIDGMSAKLSDEAIIKSLPPNYILVWTEAELSGPALPRNLGMYHASCDWILILDGDDFIVPGCIEAYRSILPHIATDVVVEFQFHTLIHQQTFVSKRMPSDRIGWNDTIRSYTKALLTGGWRRGELPIRPLLIKNEGKKYYPIDYNYLEDKVLILHYMAEDRRILLSDYCGYVRNVHPRALSYSHTLPRDEQRFKRICTNLNFNTWAIRDKIFEPWKSHLYHTPEDKAYIEDSIKYYSKL